MSKKLSNHTRKKQYFALLIFGIILGLSQFGVSYFKNFKELNYPNIEFISEQKSPKSSVILSEFDPNDLDAYQWKTLGFSDKQIATILKYKDIIGGQFISKEQFKKCYPIKDRYDELEPYILLPETNLEAKKSSYTFKTFEKRRLNIPGRFNPDLLSAKDWINMGFSEGQANAILKYKNYLGGSFISKEKLKACYIINSEQFAQMSPYVLLPEKVDEPAKAYASNFKEKQKINYHFFDPNTLDENGWKALGFSEKQAAVIINYKNRNLRGSFKSIEDVQKCFVISAEKFEELKPWIKLNPQTMTLTENSVIVSKTYTPENKTDFSRTDLNEFTFKQLLEFGFNEKTAGSLIGFRKSLGGFVNKNQIFETFGIDRDLAEKLVSTAPLNSSNVKKYTLVDAPESWLKTHPYFKYSADKIIFYRITNPDEKKIWKFIKVKPEYEAKMRLYLK